MFPPYYVAQRPLKKEVHIGYVKGVLWSLLLSGLGDEMITNDNKGAYLVNKGQKNDNVIYKWPLRCKKFHEQKPLL